MAREVRDMRTKAVALRILNQIRHDKRTVALILVAPLAILTIVYFIFNADVTYEIGITHAPKQFVKALEENDDYDVEVSHLKKAEADDAVRNGDVIASVGIKEDENGDPDYSSIDVSIDGTDSSKASKTKAIILSAAATAVREDMSSEIDELKEGISGWTGIPVAHINLPGMDSLTTMSEPALDSNYIYGSDDGTLFDNYGSAMVGIVIFFLVFLIAGINFLGERTTGTLEKLLSTPIRRHEIIVGYTLGFSVLAILQSVVVTCFVIYVLGMPVAGSLWLALLVNLLTAVCALTLGMLLSTLANSEFQMVQFIPLVIIPQVFLCGLFDLTGGWKIAGYFMPLHYTTDALTEVMLRGNSLPEIWVDLLVLVGLCAVFMAGNAALLKKQRSV